MGEIEYGLIQGRLYKVTFNLIQEKNCSIGPEKPQWGVANYVCTYSQDQIFYIDTLSHGQTDRQEDASGRKLNLRRDLPWVAKRTGTFPHLFTRVTKKPFQGRHILYFIG